MKLTVVSPHLDDAAFSTWFHLTRAAQVRVVSVFAGLPGPGTPPAPHDRITRSFDPRTRTKERRQEDALVCERNGWDYVHLDYLDAPYRTACADLREIAESIEGSLGDPDLLLVPGAIGLHADHVAARDAVLREVKPDVETRLYADLPYSAHYGWPSWVTGDPAPQYLDIDAFYALALEGVREVGLIPSVHVLDDRATDEKVAALRLYASQFDAMERGPARGLTHPARIRYEVTWHLS